MSGKGTGNAGKNNRQVDIPIIAITLPSTPGPASRVVVGFAVCWRSYIHPGRSFCKQTETAGNLTKTTFNFAFLGCCAIPMEGITVCFGLVWFSLVWFFFYNELVALFVSF